MRHGVADSWSDGFARLRALYLPLRLVQADADLEDRIRDYYVISLECSEINMQFTYIMESKNKISSQVRQGSCILCLDDPN